MQNPKGDRSNSEEMTAQCFLPKNGHAAAPGLRPCPMPCALRACGAENPSQSSRLKSRLHKFILIYLDDLELEDTFMICIRIVLTQIIRDKCLKTNIEHKAYHGHIQTTNQYRIQLKTRF